MRALGATSPGAWVGPVLARVIEWQLDHPNGTKQECEAWLISERDTGKITTQANPSAGKRKESGGEGVAKKAKKT